jgi:integrase
MAKDIDNVEKGKPVAEESVGSVTIFIYRSLNSCWVKKKIIQPDGATVVTKELKVYESFVVPYYDGSIRKTPRRSTLVKAQKLAKEVATRLNRDGARAEFFSERDRRILVFAKRAALSTGMEVDEICRKFVELNKRLKEGTLEQAVDFMNNHGRGVKHGSISEEVYKTYLEHLQKRNIGDYYLRDVKRYVGNLVAAFPGVFSQINTPKIDRYLEALGGGVRNKNNHRDAIISFFNFGEEKGFLPYGMPHAASASTEFRKGRQKISSEAEALALMQPKDIYSPEEARKLLAVKDEPLLVHTLEIKMLSGVRTEEIVRLWWVMVAEKEGLIRIPDAVGKIDARHVPILPALDRRLQAIAADVKHDRVSAEWKSANSLYHAWQRLCRKAGVPYRKNAFRKSYFTYRLVILGNIAQVAEEGGTSIEMLKKNYLSRAPVSRATAEEWFSL